MPTLYKANNLVFIASEDIFVFPSGRRGNGYDYEARLNTEFNNRRIAGMGGDKNSFIMPVTDESDFFDIVLAGYSFRIKLDNGNTAKDKLNKLGSACADKFTESSPTQIYANILTQAVSLYGDDKTLVLRNQTGAKDGSPSENLDSDDSFPPNEHYFSGFTLTPTPIDVVSSSSIKQEFVSIPILDKIDGKWVICQSSLLPKVRHGNTPDSVVIDNLFLSTGDASNNYTKVPTMRIINNQLVFTNVEIS